MQMLHDEDDKDVDKFGLAKRKIRDVLIDVRGCSVYIKYLYIIINGLCCGEPRYLGARGPLPTSCTNDFFFTVFDR